VSTARLAQAFLQLSREDLAAACRLLPDMPRHALYQRADLIATLLTATPLPPS
jgi:hypothetical protein